MSFNERLKELRLRHNLSQEKLSRKLNIVTRTYIYYEKGHRSPSLELLTRIAEFFKVSISYLLDEQSEFTVNAQEQEGKYENHDVDRLVDEVSRLFTRGDLSKIDKDAVMKAFQEAYWTAKNESE